MDERDVASVVEPAGPGSAPDPERLLARGDRRGAIAALVETHGDAVFGLCMRVLRDRAMAEDTAQQVFLEAHRDIDRFEARSSFRTWLLGIASHRCQDAIKSRRRRLQRIEADDEAVTDFEDPAAGPTVQLARNRLVAALEECLDALSPEARMTVLLRFRSGLSYQEMAASQGVKADTLHARVARALPALRRCLEGKGWDGE